MAVQGGGPVVYTIINRSELHTHPAHSEMRMGSLCAFIFFWQALFVHGKPIFLGRQVTKNAQKKRAEN